MRSSSTRIVAIIVAAGMGLAIPTGLAPAGEWVEDAKLTAGDGNAEDFFGISVDLSGFTALIGAYCDDHPGDPVKQDAGSAYVFQKSDGAWTQVRKLTASDAAADDEFGYSVSLTSAFALIGAPMDDDPNLGTNAGSAYIFSNSGGAWTQDAKLTASDGWTEAQFGISVSLTGSTALVGAYGAAYVFGWTPQGWAQDAKLTRSGGSSYDWFGRSVALSGDTALIGAHGDDANGENAGAAYVFQKTGDSWAQVAKLTASDGAAYDYFGAAVALSGDTALIGAYWDNHHGHQKPGSAYVFENTGDGWTQVAKLTASDANTFDYFGYAVALWCDFSGESALIGAWGDDDNGDKSGSAYAFRKTDSGWTQVAKLTSSDGAIGDYLGYSVSLSRDFALVGAQCVDNSWAANSGAAYVFLPSAGLGDLGGDRSIEPPSVEPTVGWAESFGSYELGSGLHGQGGWKGWDDDPAFDAFVTDAQARSAPHSVDIAVDSDLVHEFDGYTSGKWTFTTWQYIPADFTSDNDSPYVPGSHWLLLNKYDDGGPYHWSVQFVCDSDNGMMKVSYGDGYNTIDVPYVTDRWVKLQADIDLDNDLVAVSYDGEFIVEYRWTDGIHGGGGGALDIAAVDLFANNSSSVYYDDFSLVPTRGP